MLIFQYKETTGYPIAINLNEIARGDVSSVITNRSNCSCKNERLFTKNRTRGSLHESGERFKCFASRCFAENVGLCLPFLAAVRRLRYPQPFVDACIVYISARSSLSK